MLKIPNRYWVVLSCLALVAGLLYNSWPLGYLLNPIVAAKGLGSELEALHQPYNWLFIFFDTISSVIIMVVAAAIWYWHRRVRVMWLNLTLSMVFGFGIFTIIDAVLPIRCSPSVTSCPSFRQDHLLLAHGIVSIVASVCLFISVATLWWRQRTSPMLRVMMVGYIVFGAFSLIAIFINGQDNWAQHYYISLCSIWLVMLPLALRDKLALAVQV